MTTFTKEPSRDNGEGTGQSLPEEAESFVWKKFADGVCLRMRLFVPEGHSAHAFAPAVMFFYGGMWSAEYVDEFVPWAVHLSHRGIVCLLPEYRTRNRYDVSAEDIVQDGMDAWQWMN
ncbi:MAG: alpha/beta hydrolase, partial [Akkermansia sp.]